MTKASQPSSLDCGIAVIHSNQLEELRDVVEYWLRRHPLAPLENEIFLVQSNGMGQWLKQGLAQNSALGIAAAIKIQLPALFIWNAYRAVLGQQLTTEQPLAKSPLTWRLYRLLPTLVSQPDFVALARFLTDDTNCRKRFQLAEQLADLFDQYQVYRSDWINDWGNGHDKLRNAQGEMLPMPELQHWQPLLWRAIQADLGEIDTEYASRASVHTLFMNRIDGLAQRPAGIPRRIIVFGLSSLPQQSLEVLAKLGKFCQIVLFVHNPCQYYWADIIEDKELLKANRRRQHYKSGMTAAMPPEELHLKTQPLLAAWGKQGRDYIRLLDHFDETQRYANWHWPDNKIDLFKDYGESGTRNLLQQLQQTILDLEPLPCDPVTLSAIDNSLAFHIAHSPQREVEILHDQLLDRFNAAEHNGNRLHPRDIVVMVPDINKYAPHIRAVFGQIKPEDPRYIPYSLADQQQRGQNPLLVAVETLANLPESRFTVSEFLGLLEVPALRQRFGIEEAAIPTLHQWIEESGIRWGLNAWQRAQTVDGIPDHLEANTWHFGLKRMLLGYAVGAGTAFNGIEPFEEIGGLEANWLGNVSFLLETLEKYAIQLKPDKNFTEWQQTLLALMDDFFASDNEPERKILETLTRSLTTWGHNCEQAGLTSGDTLPLSVVREAWLAGVDEPTLHQRFLSGRINFCTLMPMRAIPFRIICLLGMNDGDYPRSHQPQSFDLMSQRGQYRPGDRSRRQDDQYLFLEALLSAREQLYISWVGRNIRDNSELPPSVLVSQLRDTLEQGWQLSDNSPSLLSMLTVKHPLQAFSKQYVTRLRDPRLFTYAREWFEESTPLNPSKPTTITNDEKNLTLTVESLAYFLRSPVKAFCNQTLKFGFDDERVTSEDNEPFGFNALDSYGLSNDLLNAVKNSNPNNLNDFFDHECTTLAAKGKLPLGPFALAAFDSIKYPVTQAFQQYQAYLDDWPTMLLPQSCEVKFELDNGITILLTGNLSQLRQKEDGKSKGLIHLTAQSLIAKDSKIDFHKLLLHWVQHLLGCAVGMSLQSLVISADSVLEIAPIPKEAADDLLKTLGYAWHQGLQAPLPIACKTEFAWLDAKPEQADAVAISKYEGNDWSKGEVHYDAYLARFFPNFASLSPPDSEHGFKFWADTLYRPLFDHAKLHQTVQEAQP
ncbi:exodeoxyribonuclease V gamma chain [Methyloglobulus morosus KoM1]|uniref:RecBCD enzyme subunit RecC n=1 Tax=Methyloglobulus morosus KoM1 TaxID=1116472 RepID=V5C1N4_9GAMM|nr:exodeoxyribonuclease V subunit gamma [Methyloglobulus morosus]ESS72387.1 exodeoxyribonuclease V gamma chain [Methyloglobulus morosus KoM1]